MWSFTTEADPAQFRIEGFYNPVDMEDANGDPIVNTIKSGKSVAMKFEVFDNNNVEQTSTAVIQSFKQNKINCATLEGEPLDAIEITNTGGTSLRYTGGMYHQNWKTPSGQAGQCYSATVTTIDGSSITAYFKLVTLKVKSLNNIAVTPYLEPPLTVMLTTATVCCIDSKRYVEGQLPGSKDELYC